MKTRLIMLVVLCLAFAVAPVLARDVVTVTRIDTSKPIIGSAVPPAEVVGNLNAPYWLLGGWFTGNETYAVVFDPSQQISCVSGFALTMVHMYIDFEAGDVPVTFQVQTALGSAVFDPASGCYTPGVVECSGGVYSVTIDQAGSYDLGIPITCDCAYVFDGAGNPYRYYVAMSYIGAFNARVVTDNVAATCTSFNDWGEGWADLAGYFGSYGNVNLWGDVYCCANPVSTESETWGGIKSLYR